jgi:hypothetical protein
VVFYGLADYSFGEVFEFFATREQAERMLGDLLHDEPDLRGVVAVVRVDFSNDAAHIEDVT